jgi:putative chitinase
VIWPNSFDSAATMCPRPQPTLKRRCTDVISADLLVIMPYAGTRVNAYFPAIMSATSEYNITTPRRISAFLAQLAHESSEFRYTLELADGKAYEGRADLGNTSPGDGVKYKGRGLIQITGKANYQKLQDAWGMPVVERPELLEEPEGASRSAAWFWQTHGCNSLADGDKFGSITKAINGGFNGLDQRIGYWLKARAQLRVS